MDGMMHVALLQLSSFGHDRDRNLAKAIASCRQARAMGADVALLPEMWSVGYTFFEKDAPASREAWASLAVGLDHPYIEQYQTVARELEMAIAVTYLQAWDGPPRNSVSIIDRRGEIVLTYAKVHTCDFGHRESACTPGDAFPVADLETAGGCVRVGCMICYDREQPESARLLMLGGAELILTPNACGLDSLRIDQFKTRAFENAVAVAMTNYASPQQNGHSVAFAHDGSLVVEAGEAEGIYLASLNLDNLREYRKTTIWGNAYRRPHRYAALVDGRVSPPFERENGFGEPFVREQR